MEKKAKSKANYFNQETEDAIVLYNKLTNIEEKNQIYQKYIHHAFYKLVENIIHTFKFYYTDVDNIESLKFEIISFLISKLSLFNPALGYKAYSYFGTAAKRWLILYNKANYKKKTEHVPCSFIEEDENYSYSLETEINTNSDKLNYYIDEFIIYCSDNIYKLFPDDQEQKIADSILELFRQRNKLKVLNKKALYIYIREMNDNLIKTPKITFIAKKLYGIFNKNYIFFLENDYINFPKL